MFMAQYTIETKHETLDLAPYSSEEEAKKAFCELCLAPESAIISCKLKRVIYNSALDTAS